MAEELKRTLATPAAAPERAAAPAAPRSRLATIASSAVGVVLFILAIELLKRGAGGVAQVMQALSVDGFTGTLGFGWLMAYVALSGSPVAAVSLTLLGGGALGPLDTYAMINGSRLGASFLVLATGFVYYVRGWRGRGVVSMGVLAMLTTATIYLPAMLVGTQVLERGWLDGVRLAGGGTLTSALDLIYAPITTALAAWLSPLALFALGFAVLLVAFRVFDRSLPHVDSERLQQGRWSAWLVHPATMFLLGMVVTSLTLSVSVSLAILVPLAARGMVQREPVIPYIMGANIATFVDTLFAALVVRHPMAFTIVLTAMLSVAAVSLLVLFLLYRPYRTMLLAVNRIVTSSRVAFAGFVVLLAAAPLVLLLR